MYIIEKTRFLEDLLCQTKAPRALQEGRIKGVACTLLKIKLLIVAYSFARHDFITTTRSSFMELVLRYHSILLPIIIADIFTVSAILKYPIICRYVGDISKFERVYLLQIYSKISACRLFRQTRLTHTFN